MILLLDVIRNQFNPEIHMVLFEEARFLGQKGKKYGTRTTVTSYTGTAHCNCPLVIVFKLVLNKTREMGSSAEEKIRGRLVWQFTHIF